jgi:glycine/D-amino acid oxidase-like deaminating enzyme
VVVAGAGHNSLVAAAYLSKAGFECVVLDARAGDARPQAPRRRHPGVAHGDAALVDPGRAPEGDRAP